MKIRGAVVVLEKEGKFLLQLRSNTKKIRHPNKWGLFGGMIEPGETPVKALIREIKEELNLDLEESLIEKIHERIDERYEIFFFKYVLNEELSDLKLNEGQDMKLFSKEEISNMEEIVPGLNRLFGNIKKLTN